MKYQTAIEKWVELYNAKDMDGLMAFYSPDAEFSFFTFPTSHGLDEIRAFWEMDFRAFQDAKMTILKLLSDESTIMVEWTITGTNSEQMTIPDGKIIPPTERTFTVRGVGVIDFRGDRIIKDRGYFQEISFMKQLGLLPEMKI